MVHADSLVGNKTCRKQSGGSGAGYMSYQTRHRSEEVSLSSGGPGPERVFVKLDLKELTAGGRP